MLTFSNISPAVFEAVLNELRQSATVTPVLGGYEMSGSGVSAIVQYAGERVNVTIIDKPFFVSESMIGSKVRNAIDAAQARIARQGGAA